MVGMVGSRVGPALPDERSLWSLSIPSRPAEAGWEPKISSFFMVGAIGFEPTTYGTQNRRATRLRYAPIIKNACDLVSLIALGISKAPPEPSIPTGPRLAPETHDAKTNRIRKLGRGSRFPPDRPTLPPGTVQPHDYRARPPLTRMNGPEPQHRNLGSASPAPRLVSRIIGSDP